MEEPAPPESAAGGRAPDFGVDIKGVRRATAPTVKPRRTGCLQEALRIAGSKHLRRAARRRFREGVYARSSLRGRRAKLKTVRRILRELRIPFLPISAAALSELASVLCASGYRSAPSYFGLWKKEHVLARHSWTEELSATYADCVRSVTRGLGPAKRAPTTKAESFQPSDWPLEPVCRRGPILPGFMAGVGIAWLLRGGELAALLGEQATVDEAARTATLSLSATKTDPAGTGCDRMLTCSCEHHAGPCGYHSLRDTLRHRKARGWGGKDPLFPTARGAAPSSQSVTRSLRTVLKLPGATEHTLRRMGAQLLARRGLHLYLIQFLGRWAGATIARYVDEELRHQLAMRAAYSASSGGGGGGPQPSLGVGAPFASWNALKQEVLRLVRAALPPSKKDGDGVDGRAAGSAIADGFALPVVAASGGPVLPFRAVRPVKDGKESGDRHEVIACDPCLPREVWVTRCGWRFAGSPHAISGEGQVTCERCRKFALSGGGARRPQVSSAGGGAS